MAIDRREFFLATAASALLADSSLASESRSSMKYKAIVFDAFPIFNPRPVAVLAETLFPDQGAALTALWRIKQFDYQWLRALAGNYVNFLQATEESLLSAAKQLRLELTADQRQQLMSAWSNLQIWPDVPDAIRTLRHAGLRLAFLSNMTASVLHAGLKRAGLEDMFEAVLSTDQIKTYKPDPRAYAMALHRLRLKREEILFVAFAGWDVAGARWFGYPTFWVNRAGATEEELGITANAFGQDMTALVHYITEAG